MAVRGFGPGAPDIGPVDGRPVRREANDMERTNPNAVELHDYTNETVRIALTIAHSDEFDNYPVAVPAGHDGVAH